MQPKRENANSWIRSLILLIVLVGAPLATFLSKVILQSTGLSVNPGLLIIGMVILVVITAQFGPARRALGRINSSSETKLPSTPSAPLPPSSRASSLPPQMSSQQQLSGSPRFEPIINPRLLTFGIIGLVFLGVVFLVFLAMTGAI
ncbi:MAG: hypothetical protein HGA19_09475 [Oscillochloris sp.]|nr:hypothetical protein [Oscillochloris sp.]